VDAFDEEPEYDGEELPAVDPDSDSDEPTPRKKFSNFLKALGSFDEYMKQLNETPRPPKIKDPYHYYNIAALQPTTAFYKITNMFIEDRSLPQIYMHKYDRAAHMH
jgi:hypothetical protein